MKLKFNNGQRYIIGYWPSGNLNWAYISDFLDTEEAIEKEISIIIDDHELGEEDYEDICCFELRDLFAFKASSEEVVSTYTNVKLI